MCHESGQPAGAAAAAESLSFTATDGAEIPAWRYRSAQAKGACLVLPDIYGPSPFYHAITARLAEHGFDAVMIDYFFREGPIAEVTRAAAFERRYEEGELRGHALGNLILAGLIDATGDLVQGVAEAARLLGAGGDVLPATSELVVLKAESSHGTVAGQVAVKGTRDIEQVSLVPGDAQPPPLAVERLAGADQIVIGPGSLFTSVLAAVAVRGVADAVASSEAQVVYVCNLRQEARETEGYDVAAHVAALARHDVAVDVVLCDSIGGMGIGPTEVTVRDVPLTGVNTLVHSPAKLAQVLSDLLA